jgi:hypothetical protein
MAHDRILFIYTDQRTDQLEPKALEEADRLDAILKATGKPVGPLHGMRC